MKSAIFASAVAAGAATGHVDRMAQITEIQNTPNVLWKPTANNRFGQEAPGASKSLCGVKPDWKVKLHKAIANGEITRFNSSGLLTAQAVPDSFDSETNWPKCAKTIGDIRDQSNCGCCWAFAAAEAASDRMCIATDAKMMVPVSAQDVCFCASEDGCDGGDISTPWDHIKSKGAVTGGQYEGSGPFGAGFCADFTLPHCHHHGPTKSDPYPAEGAPGCPSESSPKCPKKCDSNATSPHSEFSSDKITFSGEVNSASGPTEIKQMIMAGGPVETAFTVYSDFENYDTGIYHHVSGSMAGGHAVKIVGWGVEDGTKYWKIANSWNPYWGEKGYFRIKEGEGGIDDTVTGAIHSATWSGGGGSGPSPSPPSPTPPAPTPSPPSPTPPAPTPSPSGCKDKEDYCTDSSIFNPTKDCPALAKDYCKKTCGCCVASPPSYCSGSSSKAIVV
jgi:cathepsin B